MAISDKVIITCAVTGAIHTPTMSPYLPITPDQIAEEAIAAAEAGAASCICTLATRIPASPTRRPRRSRGSCRASSRAPTRRSTSPPAAVPTCAWKSA